MPDVTSVDAPSTELKTVPPARPVDALRALLGVLLVWVVPRTAGRWWAKSPRWPAYAVGSLNLCVIAVAIIRLVRRRDRFEVAPSLGGSPMLPLYTALLMAFCMGLYFLMLGFSILPFAARRGSNRACAWHVIRAMLFGTAFIYVWALGFYLVHASEPRLEPILHAIGDPAVWVITYAACTVLLHMATVAVLARAVGVEYRRPGDLPPPLTPRCDDCGYDLHMTPLDSRCPECGKPVAECLGSEARRPTAWQRRPNFLNIPAIIAQIVRLHLQPLRMFRTIPVYTDHAPERRWLVLMMFLIACAAFWIVGGLHFSDPDLFVGMESWKFYAIGAVIGATWAFLGLMMVGIETAGVTIASWWHGNPLEIAAAAKVASYASSVMFFWVILGGAQAIASAAYSSHRIYHFLPPRYEELIVVGSLAVAHIGGLLWFELVVYRGLRAIQFANK